MEPARKVRLVDNSGYNVVVSLGGIGMSDDGLEDDFVRKGRRKKEMMVVMDVKKGESRRSTTVLFLFAASRAAKCGAKREASCSVS